MRPMKFKKGILGLFFCPKQGQVFILSEASLYPMIAHVPSTLPPGILSKYLATEKSGYSSLPFLYKSPFTFVAGACFLLNPATCL